MQQRSLRSVRSPAVGEEWAQRASHTAIATPKQLGAQPLRLARLGQVRGVGLLVARDLLDVAIDQSARVFVGHGTLGSHQPLRHGIVHGFCFDTDSIHVYAVSHYWDLADELGCRWDDPGLGIPWAHDRTRISLRDEGLQGLPELVEELATARGA